MRTRGWQLIESRLARGLTSCDLAVDQLTSEPSECLHFGSVIRLKIPILKIPIQLRATPKPGGTKAHGLGVLYGSSYHGRAKQHFDWLIMMSPAQQAVKQYFDWLIMMSPAQQAVLGLLGGTTASN